MVRMKLQQMANLPPYRVQGAARYKRYCVLRPGCHGMLRQKTCMGGWVLCRSRRLLASIGGIHIVGVDFLLE